MLRIVLFLSLLLYAALAFAEPFTVAFYYADRPPVEELQAFDIAVVDPGAGLSPSEYRSNHSELFAYVSVGEAEPFRSYYAEMESAWLLADNPAWKTKVLDVANPEYQAFFLERIIDPLWAAGYRGFFLDTLDSYLLLNDDQRQKALQKGLITMVRGIKERYPEAQLILNRGFEILDEVRDVTLAVAAESLFRRFDPLTGIYGEVTEADRRWLLQRLNEVRRAGLPVIGIDYVPPGQRELARATAGQIQELGFIPWVTDKDLASLGVGAVEVIPRRILGLYDGSEGPDPVYSNLQRYAVMPLNHLGYQVELHDLRQPLPSGTLAGRYAGVVVWPNSDSSGGRQGLAPWLERIMAEGIKVVFLDRFGLPIPAMTRFGLDVLTPTGPAGEVRIAHRDPLVGYEIAPRPRSSSLMPVRVGLQDRSLLALKDDNGTLSDAVAITSWGGYALEPFVIRETVGDRAHWVIDPFAFFQQALRLPLVAAPDVTTENGVRMLLTHIDADGFESRVERPGTPLAATELRERILERYRLPTTFSVITSTLGDRGDVSEEAAQWREEARRIFALPFIEAGSHTDSHPFYWQDSPEAKEGYTEKYLPIPGYSFNVETEIAGSIRFMEENLLPPGKTVKLLQWSGDCMPGAEALAAAYAAGVGNINGGNTTITESDRSLTSVAPLGVARDGYYQVFAPNQNENVYTNLWTGPFYGYRRVIETFRLTDSPRRLKPINIYYHIYSATKEASRQALEDVYDWALSQRPHAIYTSAYVDKVLDFNRTVVARQQGGWLIRNAGALRQLRLPKTAGYPDLAQSRHVLGWSDQGDSRYVHLGPGGEALLVLSAAPSRLPYLQSIGAEILAWDRHDRGIRLEVEAHLPTTATFVAPKGCRLRGGTDQPPFSITAKGSLHTIDLPEGRHVLELLCP